MKIEWLGYCCTFITSGENTVLLDPYDNSLGLDALRKKARVVVATAPHAWHNNIGAAGSDAIIINQPGEYETGGIFFTLIPLLSNSTLGQKNMPASILKMQIEGLNVVYAGSLKFPIPTEIEDELGQVDILILPVGGGDLAKAEEAAKLVREIEPRAVVPVAFAQDKIKAKLGTVAAFLSEAGLKAGPAEDNFRVLKKDLPVEATVVKILNIV